MHVLHLDRSGAKSIWDLMGHVAKNCLSRGWRVTFVMWDDGRQIYSQEVPEGVEIVVIRVPQKSTHVGRLVQNMVFAREFRKVLRKINPDIVHTNFAVPSIVARWVAAGESVPVIVTTQHELYGSMNPYYRLGLRLTEHYCSVITYVSRAVAVSYGRGSESRDSGRRETSPRHVVIPNGVDISKIRRVIMNVGERVPGRIVSAGRMVREKGLQTMIEALPDVVRHHPHLCLHLIGEGPIESELRRRVDELGLAGNVRFMGWRPHDEVLREMAKAELVVVPSDGTQEGFGLVVAEALICGTPMLVSDIPVFREVLDGFDDRVTFFSAGNHSDITKKMLGIHYGSHGQVGHAECEESDKRMQHLCANVMADRYLFQYTESIARAREK